MSGPAPVHQDRDLRTIGLLSVHYHESEASHAWLVACILGECPSSVRGKIRTERTIIQGGVKWKASKRW